MTPALLADRASIARVRVRTACRDALQVSQRAGALVERLDLWPPSLPSTAILLIRTLHDPLPGSVSLARHRESAPARWKEAVAAKIAQLSCEAARPASGPASPGAGAVLFVDEAEMIACLVRDWLRGRVADHWWWRSVLGDLGPREWLRRHVLARGEVMVPAIAVLATGRDAAAWLTQLEDTEVEEAIAAIARTHAVSLSIAPDESTAQPRPRNDRRGPAGIETGRQAGSRSVALERLIATVPEVLAPELRPPQRRLLALALALTRSPSWARTPQLALALREFDRAGPPADAHARSTPEATRLEVQGPLVPRVAAAGAPSARDKPAHPAGSSSAADIIGVTGLEEFRAIAQVRSDIARSSVRDEPQNAPTVVAQSAADGMPGTQADTTPPAPSSNTAPEKALSSEDVARVRTEFGGIFYLLNAALAIQLYGDFTAPRGANLKLSPWDWLALVGRAWFGRAFVRDPVWKLLAGLAGRNRRSLRRPLWLKAQIESLLARLALALGENRRADIPALVCRYPGEVAVTATRVDVHLALSDLPLAIRIAGLDRDPGWIPAAGRAIAFHFE